MLGSGASIMIIAIKPQILFDRTALMFKQVGNLRRAIAMSSFQAISLILLVLVQICSGSAYSHQNLGKQGSPVKDISLPPQSACNGIMGSRDINCRGPALWRHLKVVELDVIPLRAQGKHTVCM